MVRGVMFRLSALLRRFQEDPQAVRADLLPAVLVWRAAPADEASPELLWTTSPGFRRDEGLRDPAVFPLRKHPTKPNGFALGITLGRATNNDLPLNHPSVSRFHAWVQLEPSGEIRLFDTGESSGTLCDGRPVSGLGAPLSDGARVRLGGVDLEFHLAASFEAAWLGQAL